VEGVEASELIADPNAYGAMVWSMLIIGFVGTIGVALKLRIW